MKKLTIYQMAQKAGVSIATISRAMNRATRYKVSAVTLAKIDLLIEKHCYVPNAAAQNLSRASSKAIGLLVPQKPGFFTEEYYAQILSGISDALIGTEYQFKLVMISLNGKNLELHNFKYGEGVDGLVIPHWPLFFQNKNFVQKLNVPLVLLGELTSGLECHRVGCDNARGGEMVGERLGQEGHRNIAVLTGPKSSNDCLQRLQGFSKGLQKNKIKLENSHVLEADFNLDKAVETVRQLFSNGQSKKKITALFCLNDLMALGAIKALKALGLSSPKEVSVVGFDNSLSSQKDSPLLTTVDQPLYEMAKGAVQILLSDLGQRKQKKKGKKRHFIEQIFPVQLLERETTARL